MNRPIKFRAWDGKRMLFSESGDFYLMPNNKVDIPSSTGHEFYRKDYPIMQFTGLHDRNGREIYEGDIVKCSRGCPHVIEFMNEVPSTNIGGMPGFYLSGLNEGYAWTGKEEVIGNLYQTPELIP